MSKSNRRNKKHFFWIISCILLQGCAFDSSATRVVTHEDWAYKNREVVNKTVPHEIINPGLLKGR